MNNNRSTVKPSHDPGKSRSNPIVVGEEAKSLAQPSPQSLQPKFHRFLDLPSELRVHVYKMLLPHDLTISFNETGKTRYSRSNSKVSSEPKNTYKKDRGRKTRDSTTNTQLFLVSKLVSTEARAILYNSNTYLFTLTSTAHTPVSLRSPLIFGTFGRPLLLPLLRNLRSIQLTVSLDYDGGAEHWTAVRQRARLQYFVEILKQHADDADKKSLLHQLVIDVKRGRAQTASGHAAPAMEKFMFCLESLVALRGIKSVRVDGVPEWFAECLCLCMQGKGGDVRKVDWRAVQAARKKKSGERSGRASITSRRWWQPVLDWKEFAERSGVVIPEDNVRLLEGRKEEVDGWFWASRIRVR